MAAFVYSRTPAFADGDAAGVVHFSRLACFVEEAEHAWLTGAGCPVALDAPDALHWPRVAFSAEYLRPVRPFQSLEVRLVALRAGRASLEWDWEIRVDGDLAARGTMKTVCCRKVGEELKAVDLPERLRGMPPG
jgi:acyl-CoA thioesterase FadM